MSSTAGCSDPVTTGLLILGTNHTLFFGIRKNWAGSAPQQTHLQWVVEDAFGNWQGLVGKGKITNVLNQFLPEIFKIIPSWALELFKIGVCLLLF